MHSQRPYQPTILPQLIWLFAFIVSVVMYCSAVTLTVQNRNVTDPTMTTKIIFSFLLVAAFFFVDARFVEEKPRRKNQSYLVAFLSLCSAGLKLFLFTNGQ